MFQLLLITLVKKQYHGKVPGPDVCGDIRPSKVILCECMKILLLTTARPIEISRKSFPDLSLGPNFRSGSYISQCSKALFNL